MVFDCIPFFNELDILKLRMHILDPYVDWFVIEEATVTFSNEPKPLIFWENREMFAEFAYKIRHVVVDDSPADVDTHLRDKFQKNKLVQGLTDCKPEDIIIFSDVDEIPNPKALQQVIRDFDPDTIYHLAQRMFYCYVNMEEVSGSLLSYTGEFPGVAQKRWLGTKICSYKMIPKENGLWGLRCPLAQVGGVRVEDGGWHFGYMGGSGEKDVSKRVADKVKAAAHQEYNEKDTLAEVEKQLRSGHDIFGRQARFERVEVDDSYPAYLREHLEEYGYLVMPKISRASAAAAGLTMKGKRFLRRAARKLKRILGHG